MPARRSAPSSSSLSPAEMKAFLTGVKKTGAAFARTYPGDSVARQPVHTVYGGAQLFGFDTPAKLGTLALKALDEYAPDAADFAAALELPIPAGAASDFARTVYDRVRAKLQREAVEDFRIDFEDGYGNRPDDEEDGHAQSAAEELARAMREGMTPPFVGIRIKTFSPELAPRSLRTLDLFVTTLTRAAGALPSGFVITLPKVTAPEQVAALVKALAALETRRRLGRGALKMEIMIEQPQAIFDAKGRVALPGLIAAAAGRCVGAHFGTYDYTASCNITAAHQAMTHPSCLFAKQVMQITLAGTGVFMSDGATNVMPIAPHRGAGLSAAQVAENRKAVHRAWRRHFSDARASLREGFYQGWDLHPAQLPTRYAAVYSFFLESLEAASARLRNFVEKAAQATLIGDVFDDAATGQGLLNYFLRAVSSGAITEEEGEATGLSLDEIRTRSFLAILKGRKLSAGGPPRRPPTRG
jgi:citrate lyase beta subunit